MRLRFLNNFSPAYAEMHFNPLKIYSGRLYRPFPEIIFDIPFRFKFDGYLPLFLMVKDADKFPVSLEYITISSDKFSEKIELNKIFNTPVHWEQLKLKISLEPCRIHALTIDFHVKSLKQNRSRSFRNDTYVFRNKIPFSFYVADTFFPGSDRYFWADLHGHSIYTNDVIEFGTPIPMMSAAAQEIGLDFFAVTDHSYDLDDMEGNSMKNDPSLKKYTTFEQELNRLNSLKPTPIKGEEASLGSSAGYNVHLLILNQQKFYPGFGDSGERLIFSRPTHSLRDACRLKEKEEIFIAAHPFKKSKPAHKILLNRNAWSKQDLLSPEIDGWQIMNGNDGAEFEAGKHYWIWSLLNGFRKFLAAGNDSHGNLNIFRQVIWPLFSMQYNYKNQFGRYRTGILRKNSADASFSDILLKIKNGHTIITNGPSLHLNLRSGNSSTEIGQEFIRKDNSPPILVQFGADTTEEFGPLRKILLFSGTIGNKQENVLLEKSFPQQNNTMNFEGDFRLDFGKEAGYIRTEVYTWNKTMAMTNPIWIQTL